MIAEIRLLCLINEFQPSKAEEDEGDRIKEDFQFIQTWTSQFWENGPTILHNYAMLSETTYCSFSKYPDCKTTLHYDHAVQSTCRSQRKHVPTPRSGEDKTSDQTSQPKMCPSHGCRGNSNTKATEQNLNRKWRGFHSELRHGEQKKTETNLLSAWPPTHRQN